MDIAFEVTVFQHISEEATRQYLTTAKRVLKDGGIFIAQMLMNERMNVKNAYAKGEGIVYYSHAEVVELVQDCGYNIAKTADHEWTDKNKSYWRYYLIQS